jgi:hypothetical protein
VGQRRGYEEDWTHEEDSLSSESVRQPSAEKSAEKDPNQCGRGNDAFPEIA